MSGGLLPLAKQALFDKKGLFLIGLMVAILSISTIDWALWKITLNRFASKNTNTAYTFFVLQIYQVLMLALSFIALMISKYFLGTIGEKEKKFPQKKFFILSVFDSIASMCASMSAPYLAGHLQTLISQAVLPLIMIASIFVLNAKYSTYHMIGAGCVLAGALIAAIPGINSKDMSGRATRGWALTLYTLSLIPLSVAYAYRELIFKPAGHNDDEELRREIEQEVELRDDLDSLQAGGHIESDGSMGSSGSDDGITESTILATKSFQNGPSDANYDQYQSNLESISPIVKKSLEGDGVEGRVELHGQPDFFYMMFWNFLYQFILSLLAFPILTLEIFGGVAWKDIPLQFSEGMKCFMGHYVKDLECEAGIAPGVILSTYICFNFCLSIIRLMLIKHGSALLLQITNALALLFSNIVFSWKFAMGQYTEKFNKWDVLGLIGVMIGFVIFQIGVYYKREEKEKKRQQLREQYGLVTNSDQALQSP